jgi:tetratricopeptide (TPR) repeat protein
MAAFIVNAEAAMERDDFDAAAAACEEVLVMDPEHAGALACLDRITVILEERRAAAEREARRLRLDALSAAVSADIEEGAFKRALDRFDTFLESEPGTPELDDLRARAEAAQRELERREAVAAAVTEKVASAVQLLSDSDCQGALACLDAAMTLDPRHPAAAALRLQLLDSLRQLSTVSVSAPAEWVGQERVMPAATESSAPDVDLGDALSLFASEADAPRSATSPAASLRHLESGVTPIVPAVSPVVSVRWPGRASRAFLATSALMPVAGGLLAFWYIVRPPALPVVAAASIDKPAPAPAVALFALTGTAAAPLNSAPTPPAAAATTAARAREAANNEAANARAAATRARTQPADVPAAPVADMAADERAVRASLQSYAGAFAALDVDGVRRVFPGTSEAGLRRSFAGIGAQQIEIRDEQMAVAGDAATVSCTWITSTVGADGSAAHTRDSRRVVFNLARRGGSWVIVDRR